MRAGLVRKSALMCSSITLQWQPHLGAESWHSAAHLARYLRHETDILMAGALTRQEQSGLRAVTEGEVK
jgi:hypothetical protein